MALDLNNAKNTLFGNLKQKESKENSLEISGIEVIKPVVKNNPIQSEIPKWQTFEKVTSLLTAEQKSALDDLAKKIMKVRRHEEAQSNRERITANTVLRAILDNVLNISKNVKLESIENEDELREWFKRILNA